MPRPKPPANPLRPGEPDPPHLDGVAVEHNDPGVDQDSTDLVFMARLEVMIAQHGDDRQFRGNRQFLHEQVRLIRQTVIGQIAAEHEHIRERLGILEKGSDQPAGILAAMDVTDRSDSNDRCRDRHHRLPRWNDLAPRKRTIRENTAKLMPARHSLCNALSFAFLFREKRPSDMDLAPVELNPKTRVFYVKSLAVLNEADVPFLVGGAYALAKHASIERHTKDLDIFVLPEDRDAVLAALESAGFRTQVSFPHWLAKAYGDDGFIDVIYSSGNGVVRVDQEWFAHASDGLILGVPVKLCPAEEMIWSKGYVQERERFDGADVAHLIRGQAETMDWERLIRRFGDHWRVLFSHLVTFGFIYPGERSRIPGWVIKEFSDRLLDEIEGPIAPGPDVLRDITFARTIPSGHRKMGLSRRQAQTDGPDVAGRGGALDCGDRGCQNVNAPTIYLSGRGLTVAPAMAVVPGPERRTAPATVPGIH